jgi:hypothetical protein
MPPLLPNGANTNDLLWEFFNFSSKMLGTIPHFMTLQGGPKLRGISPHGPGSVTGWELVGFYSTM